MNIVKETIQRTFVSIGISFLIFLLIGIFFDLKSGGVFTLTGYGFTKMTLACVACGIAFGVPTLLYESEKISGILASLIHLGIGFSVYFIAAALVGWLPVELGPGVLIAVIAGILLIGCLVWFLFMAYHRALAGKMNEALKTRKIQK